MANTDGCTAVFRAALMAAFLLGACSWDGGSNTELDADLCENCSDGGLLDAGESDAAPNPDAEVPTDATPDASTNNFPTLSDYRACMTNSDCPVGLGECVTSLELNRADPILGTSVAVSDFFPGIAAGQGVCSAPCSFDESSCTGLSLKDSNGVDVAFTCQVVVLGDLAYPAISPGFPFDSSLDLAEMALARPFGALCRPPFELDDGHDGEFCQSCTEASGCSAGACWRFDTGSLATGSDTGTCLEQVPAIASCPLGFEIRSLVDGATALGEFCVPLTETCGPCLDSDEDGYGAGHCQEVAIDCDDNNSDAYFDPADMEHAFPAFCGDFDYNCNGLSDQAEQVGVEAFEAFHCESCGDDFHNTIVNTGQASEATLLCAAGTMIVETCADASRVHCDGDPRIVGCEASDAGGGQLYYRDVDIDTFGDPNVTSLGCPSGAPDGFVSNNSDCNDGDNTIRPGALDSCDCWGDCATTGARIDNDCDGQVDEDIGGYNWFTDTDLDGAGEVAIAGGAFCGAPIAGAVLGTAADCAAGDASSFGAYTQVTDAVGTPLSLPITSQPPRDAAGELYLVLASAGIEVCDTANNDCDGATDEGVLTTFNRDFDVDGFGDASTTTDACTVPAGFVVVDANALDCNDNNNAINPDADELCDTVDRNCDGNTTAGAVFSPTCDTGLLGTCGTGVQTCQGTSLACTQDVFPDRLDDPDPATADDEDCDGNEVIIYVSSNGLTTNTGRDPGAPTLFLSAALLEAQNNPLASQIHIEEGSYDLGISIGTVSNVDLIGGFDANFDWADTTTTLSRNGTPGPFGRVVAIFADNSSSIAHVDISTAAAVDSGTDQYGLFAFGVNADILLKDVAISVAQGSDGTAGTAGSAGDDGPDAAGFLGGANICNTATGGGTGAAFGTTPQAFGDDPGLGGVGSADAGDGGHTGQSRGAGGGTGIVHMGTFGVESSSSSDGSAGDHGSGGGGATCSSNIAGRIGGGGGAGGCGGGAGSNGTRGGWSIGLLSTSSAQVTLDNVFITAGDGGDGGLGGASGLGGVGGVRGLRTGSTCGNGGYGSGATGGGSGAGGHGGNSYAIFHQGASDLCSDGSLDSTTATASLPGAAGGSGVTLGSGGDDGDGGSSAADGNSGDFGRSGQDRVCFWSEECSVDSDCSIGASPYCRLGRCYE